MKYDTKKPMKYEVMPTINGTNLSVLLDMSLSVPIFFAQPKIIAIGNIDEKTSEINSKTMNLDMLNSPFSKDSTMHIIKNNGMQSIGGLVISEITLAVFNLFI